MKNLSTILYSLSYSQGVSQRLPFTVTFLITLFSLKFIFNSYWYAFYLYPQDFITFLFSLSVCLFFSVFIISATVLHLNVGLWLVLVFYLCAFFHLFYNSWYHVKCSPFNLMLSHGIDLISKPELELYFCQPN